MCTPAPPPSAAHTRRHPCPWPFGSIGGRSVVSGRAVRSAGAARVYLSEDGRLCVCVGVAVWQFGFNQPSPIDAVLDKEGVRAHRT